MTVLQLASIYQTIANNGVRIPPRIVQSVTKPDGSVTTTSAAARHPRDHAGDGPDGAHDARVGDACPAAPASRPRSPATGSPARPAPRSSPTRPTAARTRATMNWDTFAGMVPADNPQFVVAIMVDNPAHGLEGGDVAAPLFHQIATYEVQHAHVPPTGSTSQARAAAGLRRHQPARRCPLTSADVASTFGRRSSPADVGTPVPAARTLAARGRDRAPPAAVRRRRGHRHHRRQRPRAARATCSPRCPGAQRTARAFAADARGRRRGRRADRRAPGARPCPPASPVLVVPDVRGRARPGGGAASTATRARRCRMLGVTGTSGKTTTTFLMRAGLQAAGRVHRADRHGGDADRRRRDPDRVHHPGGARRAGAARGDARTRRHRRRDGGVEPRAGDGPRRRHRVRRRPRSPTCPRTISTSTPTWRTTSPRRRCCSSGRSRTSLVVVDDDVGQAARRVGRPRCRSARSTATPPAAGWQARGRRANAPTARRRSGSLGPGVDLRDRLRDPGPLQRRERPARAGDRCTRPACRPSVAAPAIATAAVPGPDGTHRRRPAVPRRRRLQPQTGRGRRRAARAAPADRAAG